MGTRYFTPKLFAFLRDLAESNDRDWFRSHQDDYERHVREPALDFIADAAEPLARISEHFRADTRKVGGSLFRIQRDVRFSQDKSPYKTNTGMHFRHIQARDAHAPGFYIHLEPRSSFIGVGLWRPDAATAYAIRSAIDESQDAWVGATREPSFRQTFVLDGDSLKRPPRGYGAEHPLIDDLKRKDFVASARIAQSQITSDHFLEDFIDHCRRAAPYMAFLCRATGVPF
ncbi:MAG: DUF2461 domain-containing protein [bacterium]